MIKILTGVLAALLFNACTAASNNNSDQQTVLPEPSLEKIAEGVWIHKSYAVIEPWGPILSQGMVIQTDAGLVLVDTTWDNVSTKELLGLIKDETGATPVAAIVTHAHSDKMGGMDALHEAGIKTFAHKFTNEDALKRSLTPAQNTVLKNAPLETWNWLTETEGQNGTSHVSLFYPGAGHARDNIVVYYAPANILFGGCLIRPGKSKNLGNTADGDVANWAIATREVAIQFPTAELVIPSHGAMGGSELLAHTIALAEAANE